MAPTLVTTVAMLAFGHLLPSVASGGHRSGFRGSWKVGIWVAMWGALQRRRRAIVGTKSARFARHSCQQFGAVGEIARLV
ncbi:MAG: hypothetical protein ACKVIQ_07585 [Acidimicrobiales bacterium]